MSDQIVFHHIRNATSKLSYSGLNLLIDPFFTPKEYYPGFELGPTLEIKKYPQYSIYIKFMKHFYNDEYDALRVYDGFYVHHDKVFHIHRSN